MAIRVTTDVVCDRCAAAYNGVVDTTAQNTAARSDAKDCGWHFYTTKTTKTVPVDLCPGCTVKFEKTRRCGKTMKAFLEGDEP